MAQKGNMVRLYRPNVMSALRLTHGGPAGNASFGRPGGGAAAFSVVLELQAEFGAEKTGPVQCTANNDVLIHWDSLDDVYRFAVTGTHLYRNPLDGGFASSAPDSEAEGVRTASNLSNASASENFSRNSFTAIMRFFNANAGAGTRLLWQQWLNGPRVEYSSAGVDNLVFTFPGVPGTAITLNPLPENQMATAVMRFDLDNLTVHAAVYDEDGTTLIDSGTLAITSLTSGGDTLNFGGSGAFHLKRFAYINEFVDGDALTDLLTRILTDDPLPVS